jgi:hypothetical protein
VPLVAASPASAQRPNDLKDVLIGLALNAAQNLVHSGVQRKLAPVARLLDGITTPSPTVSSTEWPAWYVTAVHEQQPKVTAAELARIQAQEITDARTATQMARSAIDHMKSINSIMMRD